MDEIYEPGDTMRITVVLADDAGVPSNPTTLTLSIRPPRGLSATVLNKSQLQNPIVGTFYYDYTFPTYGEFAVNYRSTGTPQRSKTVRVEVMDNGF